MLNSTKSENSFLVVDIGSDTVKCMAFEVDRSTGQNIANIVGVGKVNLYPGATRGGIVIDYDEVLEALKEAVKVATDEAGYKIKESVIGISGEVSVGMMTTIKMTRGNKSPITEDELGGVYEKIHEAAYTEVSNQFYEITGNSDVEIELITSSVAYSKLDGEEVKDLVGRKGQKVEIALFTAFSPSFHIKMLQKLAKKSGIKILAIGSEMYSLVKSLSYADESKTDFAVMDIGGEITDVGIVFGGGIVATRSFSIGGAHFTMHLEKKMNMEYFEAEKLKLDYSFSRLSEEQARNIQTHVYDVLEIWLSGIEVLFMEFTGVKTFPSHVYLVGGGSALSDLVDHVKTEPWTRSIPFKSPPEFLKVSLDMLPKVIDKTGNAQSVTDVMPAALSIIYLEAGGFLNE